MVPKNSPDSPTAADRFWAKVEVRSQEECWTWIAARNTFGYGAFHPSKKRTVGAHRFSLEIALGRPIHPGMFACHHCDNPACVNPTHLYEGTSQDNVDDAVRRGRHKRGSMDSAAKLDDAEVIAIRTRAASGTKNRSLAAEYGVQESLISQITTGKRWAHIGGPLSSKYKIRKAA